MSEYQRVPYWDYMLKGGQGDQVNHPSHYNKSGVECIDAIRATLGPEGFQGIESDGGPSPYYDFLPGWKTWNDFADHKAKTQWKEFSFHLGNVGKSLCRWGDKNGTTKTYDARKIVYSGLRILMMLEGKNHVRKYLEDLLEDGQFRD